MSEFKYACPHCGQHIRCDATQSGTTMECPTCFQKIIAPQAPAGHDPKFILTGSKLPKQRPLGTLAGGAGGAAAPEKKFPLVPFVVVVLVAAAATAAFLFRDKIFKSTPAAPVKPPVEAVAPTAPAPPPPPAPKVELAKASWKLALEDVELPAGKAAGQLNGASFICDRALLTGGTLVLRQGMAGPAAQVFVINLHAKRSADLAGQSIAVTTNQSPVPRVVLRWKADSQSPGTKNLAGGYALRLEFGALAGARLPGKIYLCTPDEAQSYVAGNFTAEIVTPKPAAKQPPKRKP